MPDLYDKWQPMNPQIPTCPACGSTSVTAVNADSDYPMFRCGVCEHTWEEETE